MAGQGTKDDLIRVATDPDTPGNMLADLARSDDQQVRSAVARSPNTPFRALASLTSRIFDQLEAELANSLAWNPNTPATIMNALALYPVAKIRGSVARNPGATPAILIHLATDLVDAVRRGVASNFAYDKAAGRKDQEALNSLGMYLTTRAIGDQLDSNSNSHYLKPKPIGSYKPADGCKHTYHLVAIEKRLHLHLINDTGEDTYIPLKHVHRSVTGKGKRYNYTDHEVDCQTRAGHKHTVTIPWNGWKSFNHKSKNSIQPVDRQRYDHILRYLQPHAPGTEDFKQAYGMRERTETMHSIIDALLYFKVLQRWGKAAKSAFIFGYLMGHNILARAAQDGELRAIIRPDA